MDTRRLRYFLEVAHTGSFTGAAARLRIAQPALSKQVGLLEQELGQRLFVRHGRGVSLTAAGDLVRERSVAIIHQLDQLGAEVAQHVEQPLGPVVLGMPPTLRDLVTLPAVSEFYHRFPAARLRTVEANVVVLRDQVASGQLDVAIIPDFESLQGFDVHEFAEEALCIVGPSGSGLEMNKPKKMGFLRGLPLIMTSHPNSFRRLIERAVGQHGLELDVRMEADTLPLSLDLINACGCYSVHPVSAIRQHVTNGAVAAAPIIGKTVRWVIVGLHGRPRSTATRVLIKALEENCRRAIENRSWTTAIQLVGSQPMSRPKVVSSRQRERNERTAK
jgi:LysR family nitrogen assimilation transcriptional regulator